jgi:SAM-dependent methyltransferase
MADYREVTACRLCESPELVTVLELAATPLANELDGTDLFPLTMNRCAACGHHQLSIAVAPERLWGPDYPYASGTSPVWREHLSLLADEVAQLKPGGRVLEIGSNDGTLCNMLYERNMRVVGVDPSAPDERVQMGVSIVAPWPHPDVLQMVGKGERDAIIALHVFAHVDDLHGFTAAVKEALAPGGVFIVEVGYLCEVVERGTFDCIYHEHMSYHAVRPLAGFFERHGLRIERVEQNNAQGGSIRLYVRHLDEVPWFDAGDEDVPDVEALGALIRDRGEALREGFAKLQKRGEKVAIYGVPAKLTTLLYAPGLQDFPFVCVGEDNPRKVGRTTPGNHIPIVSVDDMLAKNPDTIFLAAWNFADDITRKLRERGFQGGIINPMRGGD